MTTNEAKNIILALLKQRQILKLEGMTQGQIGYIGNIPYWLIAEATSEMIDAGAVKKVGWRSGYAVFELA